MTHQAAVPPCADPNDPLAEWAAKSCAQLGELAEMGMELARDVKRLARNVAEQVPVGAQPKPETIIAAETLMKTFAKVARAVRCSIALQGRILAGPRASRPLSAPAWTSAGETPAVRQEPPDPDTLESRRIRGRLRRAAAVHMAQTAIDSLDLEGPERERLIETLYSSREWTWPEDADFADEIVDELAVTLCRRLGLAPSADWWETNWGGDLSAIQPIPKSKPPP